MKPTWAPLFERTGSVLLAVGLALGLISVVPPAPLEHIFSWSFAIDSGEFRVCSVSRVCSPKTGLRVSGISDGELRLYLIGSHRLEILGWIKSSTTTGIPGTDRWADDDPRLMKLSFLEAFLTTHREQVLLNQTVGGLWDIDFFPRSVTNVTLVLSKPTGSSADHPQIDMKSIVALAPERRVVLTAALLVSWGVALVVLGKLHPDGSRRKYTAGMAAVRYRKKARINSQDR